MDSNSKNTGDRHDRYDKRRTSRGSNRSNQYDKGHPKAKTSKFTGVNKDELEGIVICENMPTPTAQQYDTPYDTLVVYGGSRNAKVRTSLRKMKYITKEEFEPPKPSKSTYVDEDGIVDTVLQTARINVWMKECEDAYKRYNKYKESMEGLFETIMGQLGLEIKNSLKGSEDWDQVDESNDTIGLLKILRELCYRDNSNRVHAGIDLISKLTKFLQSRQNDRTAATFVEETTNKWEVFRSTGGSIMSEPLMRYVIKNIQVKGSNNSYQDYLKCKASTDKDDKEYVRKIEENASQLILSLVIINGSNDKMHQGLRTELMKDYAKGHDNYPTNPNSALDLLNQFKSKIAPKNNKQGGGNRTAERRDDKTVNKEQPNSSDENNKADDSKVEKNFTNVSKEKSTSVSAQKAHMLLLKEMEDEDSDEEFMFLHYEVKPDSDNDESLNDYPIPRFVIEDGEEDEYSGNYNDVVDKAFGSKSRSVTTSKDHSKSTRMEYIDTHRAFMFAQNTEGVVDPWWLLLDSQATCNIICNPRIVSNIRTHPDGKQATIYCNAGSVVVNTVADLTGFGMVWFSKECIANILSLALVSDQFRVTLDTAVTQGFFVHRQDGTTRRFDRTECDLYVCDLKHQEETILVTTVDGQKEYYSDLDFRRAKAARKLQETLGYPSKKAFLKMIDNNLIKNCPITRRDVLIAEDIYGVNTNIIKGKSVRKQPKHVREDLIPVPPKILERYKKVTLGIDVYHINGIRFFRSVSRHLMFRTTQCIKDATANTYFKQVQRIAGRYALRGFRVVQVFGDGAFTCIKDRLMTELGIEFFPVARGAHEPHIERDNRVSKERCRCIYAGLPFRRMPPRMIIELAIAVDYWLNYWCSSGGVSKTIPPRQFMTGIALDASKHCRFQYGDYVLGHNESDNTMKPRANDAIYLRPTGTPDGAFFVFDLKTAMRVRKHSATLAHMTDSVIKRVEAIASGQGAPVGLNFGDADNNSTILDIDTQPTNTDDDDSNASDSDYDNDEDDDNSEETKLTGVVDESDVESIRSGGGYTGDQEDDGTQEEERHTNPENETDQAEEPTTENEAEQNEIEDSAAIDPEATNTGDDNNMDDNTNPDHEQEEETIIFEDENTADDRDGSINIIHPSVYEEQQERHQHDSPPKRMELRSSVTKSHPKYGPSDGFSETTRQRNLFSKGYYHAIRKLETDHAKLVLVSHAIEQYNAINASPATPQYNVNKGLKIFGELGAKAVLKELQQLHDLSVISPVHPSSMTREDIKKALPYLMFLKRKRCGKIKGRGCADGRSQRDYISKDDASSPTASLYAVILTCLIDAIEGRCVATTDIPGAFLQTMMPKDEVVYIRITGAMAELLCEIDHKLYADCIVTTKKGTKVLYARANKAIYGTLRAALLFWKKLKGKLVERGFKENPYDPCTVNKLINGKQATIVWHVDDLKISHKDEQVVRQIIKDLDKEFGTVAPLTTEIGKVHDYLGMTIDFSVAGKVQFSMFDYLQEIIDSLPDDLITNRNTTSPAAEHLFDIDDSAKKLTPDKAEIFHSYTAKLLFAAKRARPDIQTSIAFLCTRVKSPDTDDWKKLARVLGYIKDTIFLPLTIGWDGTGNIYWYVDASFAVHSDMRSHTGSVITFGTGAAISMSTKQKINTKSSTEAELVGVDDALPLNIWCKYFLQEQGYQANNDSESTNFIGHTNVLYQDNTSSIRLENNGKGSSTKRTRHIHIRYFLITDRIKQGDVNTVEHCPTTDMLADYFTKPLQGSLFRRFRNTIMGLTDAEYLSYKLAYDKSRDQSPSKDK